MFTDLPPHSGHNPRPMDGRIDSFAQIGQRLRALRIAKGYADNQSGFAKMCGITPQAWNNYETGSRRPDLESAAKIRQATGVTYDFIYNGVMSHLPMDLASAIQQALASELPQRA